MIKLFLSKMLAGNTEINKINKRVWVRMWNVLDTNQHVSDVG